MCGAVATELMTGVRGDQAVLLESRLAGMRWLTVDEPADWFAAASIRSDSNRRGHPISFVDSFLAALALRSACELWTLDKGFQQIASVRPDLQVRLLAR
jgi:predicted nucleic acid-binding protein